MAVFKDMTESETEIGIREKATLWTAFQLWLDRAAVCMAGLCLVHCLLTPVLLVVLPIIGTTFFVHESFHLWMILLVIPTTSVSIFLGCRKHKEYTIGILSGIGMTLLVLALFIGHPVGEGHSHGHDHGHVHNHTQYGSGGGIGTEAILTTLGGLFLAGAHIRNYRLCRKAQCHHH